MHLGPSLLASTGVACKGCSHESASCCNWTKTCRIWRAWIREDTNFHVILIIKLLLSTVQLVFSLVYIFRVVSLAVVHTNETFEGPPLGSTLTLSLYSHLPLFLSMRWKGRQLGQLGTPESNWENNHRDFARNVRHYFVSLDSHYSLCELSYSLSLPLISLITITSITEVHEIKYILYNQNSDYQPNDCDRPRGRQRRIQWYSKEMLPEWGWNHTDAAEFVTTPSRVTVSVRK